MASPLYTSEGLAARLWRRCLAPWLKARPGWRLEAPTFAPRGVIFQRQGPSRSLALQVEPLGDGARA